MSTEPLAVTGWLARSLFVSCCIVLPACNEGPAEPAAQESETASLQVEILVDGTRPDADGFTVVVILQGQGSDRPTQQVASDGGTIRFAELPTGTHAVRLESLAPNCRVRDSGNTRPFAVAGGEELEVEFAVSCPGPGTLLIRTQTWGRDLDTDGYVVEFEGTPSSERSIGANDTLRVLEKDIPADAWRVRLRGLAPNCLLPASDPVQLHPSAENSTRAVSFSALCIASGSRIAFLSNGDVFLAPVDGSVVNVTSHPAFDWGPVALSPDRQRILFSSDRDRPEGDLYKLEIVSGRVTRLTTDLGIDFLSTQPWSPDGSKIVFTSTREDSLGDIYIMNADGSGVVRLTHDLGTYDLNPAWNPDGASIAFCRLRATEGAFEGGIYRMSAVDGSGVVKLVDEGCDPAWSPTGSQIAFTAGADDEFSISRVAIVNADGSGLREIFDGWSPTWGPTGFDLVFNAPSGFEPMIRIAMLLGSSSVDTRPFLQGLQPSWR